MNEGRGREEHEILCSKRALKSEVNIQMIKTAEKRIEKLISYGELCSYRKRVKIGSNRLYELTSEMVS